jgi:hypothetical protein
MLDANCGTDWSTMNTKPHKKKPRLPTFFRRAFYHQQEIANLFEGGQGQPSVNSFPQFLLSTQLAPPLFHRRPHGSEEIRLWFGHRTEVALPFFR